MMIFNFLKVIPFLFFCWSSFSKESPVEADERPSDPWGQHCAGSESNTYYFQNRINDFTNRLSFLNQGGLFNSGVCWWHSRWTRISAYLLVFDPNQKRPKQSEAKDLIERVRKGFPTTIPGYRNLYEFSIDFKNEIQSELDYWQVLNGGFEFGFMDGLTGNSDEHPNYFTQTFNDLKIRTDKGQIVFQVLQFPGVTSHSWLVTSVKKNKDGYEFNVLDSNFYYPQSWKYIYPNTHFLYWGNTPFANYTSRQGLNEETILRRRIQAACSYMVLKRKKATELNFPMDLDQELKLSPLKN